MKLLLLSRADVEALLDIRTAVSLVDEAMRALSRGETRHLTRRIMPLPGSDGGLGDMPGSLGAGRPFGLKCIAGFPSPQPGQSSHRGAVLLFDPNTGEPVAVMEAGVLTALRTAAASASATRYLARPDAQSLAIFGTGEQARWHVPALLAVHAFSKISIWSRNHANAEQFAKTVQQSFGVECAAIADAAEAAAADVICTVTSASTPVLHGEWLRPGAHVNLVGSSSAVPREADDTCVALGRYFVDWEESARAQASEFLHARQSGAISDAHLVGEIGAVANGTLPGRQSSSEITIYKSLGVIVQDLACGWYVYQQAREHQRGTWAEF